MVHICYLELSPKVYQGKVIYQMPKSLWSLKIKDSGQSHSPASDVEVLSISLGSARLEAMV